MNDKRVELLLLMPGFFTLVCVPEMHWKIEGIEHANHVFLCYYEIRVMKLKLSTLRILSDWIYISDVGILSMSTESVRSWLVVQLNQQITISYWNLTYFQVPNVPMIWRNKQRNPLYCGNRWAINKKFDHSNLISNLVFFFSGVCVSVQKSRVNTDSHCSRDHSPIQQLIETV